MPDWWCMPCVLFTFDWLTILSSATIRSSRSVEHDDSVHKLTIIIANQIWAKNLSSDFPWGDNGGYSGVFGLEAWVCFWGKTIFFIDWVRWQELSLLHRKPHFNLFGHFLWCVGCRWTIPKVIQSSGPIRSWRIRIWIHLCTYSWGQQKCQRRWLTIIMSRVGWRPVLIFRLFRRLIF